MSIMKVGSKEAKNYAKFLARRRPHNPIFLEVLERIAKEGKAPQGGLLEAALDTTEEIMEDDYWRHARQKRQE